MTQPRPWCDVLAWNEHGVQAPHGYYEPCRGHLNPCPKCINAEEEPHRRLDPRDDQYRHRLAEGAYSFHPAADDWHPCFYGGLVGVGIIPYSGGMAKVHIKGADDTAMALGCDSYEEAREVVQKLLRMPFVPMKRDLYVMGFFWD